MPEQDERRQRNAHGVMAALLLWAMAAVMLALHLTLRNPQTAAEPAAPAFAGGMLFPASDDPPQITPPPEAEGAFRVEVLHETEPPAEPPRILIYHTHTWEAYEQIPDERYQETEKWRTKDERHNVTAVGAALANALRALGCTVVHDTGVYEPPNLEDAYQRSLAMLEQRSAAGECYDLYLDVHRDAVSSASTIRRTVNIGGTEVARFMVLVGKGSSYAQKPDWEANYALAQMISQSLNQQQENLARDVKVKTGRFNQHIAPCCVLLECGTNRNTLEEVLAGIPYLAQSIMDALAAMDKEKPPGD